MNFSKTSIMTVAIGLAIAMLTAITTPAMAAIIDHNSITYVTNTPLNANTTNREDNGGDQLTDGIVASTDSAHNSQELVYWLENEGAPNADPVWDGTKPEVTFDLGSVYAALDSVEVWYGGRFDLQGPQGMTLSFSLDDITYTSATLYNSATYPGLLDNAYTTVTETISYSDTNFQYVKIEFDPQQGDWMTLGEVTFDGTAVPVPEPASLALIGLGGLMLMNRKRRA